MAFTDLTTSRTNRVLHFALEIAVWVAFALWGFSLGEGWFRTVLAVLVPFLVIITWTAFGVPRDPWLPGGMDAKPEPWVALPRWLRLLYEVLVHGAAAWIFLARGWDVAALVFGVGFLIHYAVSYQRVLWLIGLHPGP